MVWVQDYHLMLLPAMLKNKKPKMKVRWAVYPVLVSLVQHAFILCLSWSAPQDSHKDL